MGICEEFGGTENVYENEYAELICAECDQNRQERAWERHCEVFYGGGGPLTLREQQIEARKLK